MIKERTLWITRTAVFIALLVVLQAATGALGSTIITGSDDCFRYDLRHDVRALRCCHFACYGEADWNRPSLEPDPLYRGRKHYPHADLALHWQQALGA